MILTIVIFISSVLALTILGIYLVYIAGKKIDSNEIFLYIAGPISGHNIDHCIVRFNEAKTTIQASGIKAVTPFDVVPKNIATDESKWGLCMIHCLKTIEKKNCIGIVILSGWDASAGSKIEYQFAKRENKFIKMYDKFKEENIKKYFENHDHKEFETYGCGKTAFRKEKIKP